MQLLTLFSSSSTVLLSFIFAITQFTQLIPNGVNAFAGPEVILNSIVKVKGRGNPSNVNVVGPTIPFGQVYNLSSYPTKLPPVYGYDIYDITVLLPLPPEYIVCQAFLSPSGVRPIGAPFKKAPSGTQLFFPLSSSPSSSPISISSIFCSDAPSIHAWLSLPSPPLDGIPPVSATPRWYVGVSLFPDVEKGPFDLQYVLIDNSVKKLRLTNGETEAFIFAEYYGKNPGVVGCQLYEDEGGYKRIGGVITENRTVLADGKGKGKGKFEAGRVRAIRCKGTPAGGGDGGAK